MFIRIIELNCRSGIGFNFELKDPSHGHLFVRFKSRASVLTAEGYKNAEPGDFIFYRAEEKMAYSSGDWAFVHDYFRFYLEDDEQGLFDLPTSTLFRAPISSKLEELLRLMMLEFYSANKNKTESLGLYGKLFLLGSSEFIQNESSVKTKIREDLVSLRARMLSSPEKDWTVDLLSAEAYLSPSYFQGLYKKTFGISPINDLIEARVRKAEGYLLSSNKKEEEIAARCGYKNIEHFIRQFHRQRGVSPSDFKKRMKN